MNKLVVLVGALVLGSGCSSKRVPECDEFVQTIEKISKCEKLPEEQRKPLAESAKQIKDALQMIDDAGGVDKAPDHLVRQMKDTCKTQNRMVVEQFQKLAPECMK